MTNETTTNTPTTSTSTSSKCCDACGKPQYLELSTKPLLKCSRCKQVWYHDSKCQKQHYKVHKLVCQQWAASYRDGIQIITLGGQEKEGQEEIKQEMKQETQEIIKQSYCHTNDVLTTTTTTTTTTTRTIQKTVLGRVAITRKEFPIPGTIVVAEPPAIVFDTSNGFFGLWNSYLQASSSTQQDILNLQATTTSTSTSTTPTEPDDLNTPRQQLVTKELKRFYAASSSNKSKLSETIARELVRIVDLNAHVYHPPNTTTSNNVQQPPQTAIYPLGSMLEHSCSPNVTSSQISDLGLLVYKTEYPNIPMGERISWSYIPRVFERHRKDRLQHLQSSKSFDCFCRRCLGPDDCIPLNCPTCSSTEIKGSLFQFYNGMSTTSSSTTTTDQSSSSQPTKTYIWKCVICDFECIEEENETFITSQLSEMSVIGEKVSSMKHQMDTSGQINPMTLLQCFIVQGQVTKTVHSLHYLHPLSWEMIQSISVAIIKARLATTIPGQPLSQELISSLQLSAVCHLKRAIWLQRLLSLLQHNNNNNNNNNSSNSSRNDSEDSTKKKMSSSSSFLKTLVQDMAQNKTDTEQALSPNLDPKLIPPLIDALVPIQNDNEQQQQKVVVIIDHTVMAPMIFYAGLDLLLANEQKYGPMVAKLYKQYQSLFLRWNTLSKQQNEIINGFIELNGTKNPFPNHYLL